MESPSTKKSCLAKTEATTKNKTNMIFFIAKNNYKSSTFQSFPRLESFLRDPTIFHGMGKTMKYLVLELYLPRCPWNFLAFMELMISFAIFVPHFNLWSIL